MTTPTNPIERLDVPVAEVEAQTTKPALTVVDLSVKRLRWLLAHPTPADPAHVAEQSHWVDPDDPRFTTTASQLAEHAEHSDWQPGGAS